MSGGLSTINFGRVLQRPGQGRIPVVVVGGFLGAGKTTILRALLATEAGRGSALVVNEFGAVGIDDALLREGSERAVLLGNGCLCCLVQSDLQATLRGLFADRAAGRVAGFARVIIELSGLADPGAVLQTFAADRALTQHFSLAAVVGVVDVASALGTDAPEWARQVALADRILLTKTDLVGEDVVGAVRARVAAVNATAPVAVAARGVIDPAFLLDSGAATWSAALRCEAVAHGAGIESFVWAWERPLDWGVLSLAMRTLAELRGPDLLRVKGLVNLGGRPGPVLVQFVQHLAHPPEELAEWPDADRRTRLVFVTRGIGRSRIEGLLGAVLTMDSPTFQV